MDTEADNRAFADLYAQVERLRSERREVVDLLCSFAPLFKQKGDHAVDTSILDQVKWAKEQIERLEAERNALLPYVQHLPNCATGWLEPCDCGLPVARKIGEEPK